MADFLSNDILYDMFESQKAIAAAYCGAALRCNDRALAKRLMAVCEQQQEMAFDTYEAIKKYRAQECEITEISQLENALNCAKEDKSEM